MSDDAYAGEILPPETWKMLAEDPAATLIDVRTRAEWVYVGVPDLGRLGKQVVFVEWIDFPGKNLNPAFTGQIGAACPDKDAPLLFICRSGIRSKKAAIAMTALGHGACYNVTTGFEGDPDDSKHRGSKGGWKVDGLPWVQE